jgi:cytochrome c oxidase subunit 2
MGALLRFRRCSLAAVALVVVLAVPGTSQDRKVVRVMAERFTFTPAHIKVKRGTVIEFKVRSDDTNHGFHIVGSSANVIVPKRGRGEATLVFNADAVGHYTFQCSKMCGAGHAFMRGSITVEE